MLVADIVIQLTPWDRDSLELPTSTQNKDGVWHCKKHGSAGGHTSSASNPGHPRSCVFCRLQPVLRLEETALQASHQSQESRQEGLVKKQFAVKRVVCSTVRLLCNVLLARSSSHGVMNLNLNDRRTS